MKSLKCDNDECAKVVLERVAWDYQGWLRVGDPKEPLTFCSWRCLVTYGIARIRSGDQLEARLAEIAERQEA